MESAFVDSSAWIDYAGRKARHHKAVKAALKYWSGRLVTSNFIFEETTTYFVYDGYHSVAMRVGDMLRKDKIVNLVRITEEDENIAWELLRHRPDKSYSFTDCTSFTLMRRLGIKTAITLDEDFKREGFHTLP